MALRLLESVLAAVTLLYASQCFLGLLFHLVTFPMALSPPQLCNTPAAACVITLVVLQAN